MARGADSSAPDSTPPPRTRTPAREGTHAAGSAGPGEAAAGINPPPSRAKLRASAPGSGPRGPALSQVCQAESSDCALCGQAACTGAAPAAPQSPATPSSLPSPGAPPRALRRLAPPPPAVALDPDCRRRGKPSCCVLLPFSVPG